MEVLLRCISNHLKESKPGKEIVIQLKLYLTNPNRFSQSAPQHFNIEIHYTCKREARSDLLTLKKRVASNSDLDQKKQKPSSGSNTTYSSSITVKSLKAKISTPLNILIGRKPDQADKYLNVAFSLAGRDVNIF